MSGCNFSQVPHSTWDLLITIIIIKCTEDTMTGKKLGKMLTYVVLMIWPPIHCKVWLRLTSLIVGRMQRVNVPPFYCSRKENLIFLPSELRVGFHWTVSPSGLLVLLGPEECLSPLSVDGDRTNGHAVTCLCRTRQSQNFTLDRLMSFYF